MKDFERLRTENNKVYDLPFYVVKDKYGSRKIRMEIASSPQRIERQECEKQLGKIEDIYRGFNLLKQEIAQTAAPIFRGLPLDPQKSPSLWYEAKRKEILPFPNPVIARIDVVGNKIVDINNKPAGLGLTCAAESEWEATSIWPQEGEPMKADLGNLLPAGFERAIVVTEEDYPFASDQIRLTEIAGDRTKKRWRVCFPDKEEPDIKNEEAIFCFSYLSSPQISSRWRDLLLREPDRFLVNPLAALFWDNKALMALPFLKIDLENPLREALEKLKEAFPPTYLFKADEDDNLVLATSIGKNGLIFQTVSRENVPTPGRVYLKPLGQSGGREIIVKSLNDWGGTIECLKRYAVSQPQGFIIQEKVEPKVEQGFQIKNGYFINLSGGKCPNLITIERMGTNEETEKIHGGSRTKLIPVFLSSKS